MAFIVVGGAYNITADSAGGVSNSSPDRNAENVIRVYHDNVEVAVLKELSAGNNGYLDAATGVYSTSFNVDIDGQEITFVFEKSDGQCTLHKNQTTINWNGSNEGTSVTSRDSGEGEMLGVDLSFKIPRPTISLNRSNTSYTFPEDMSFYEQYSTYPYFNIAGFNCNMSNNCGNFGGNANSQETIGGEWMVTDTSNNPDCSGCDTAARIVEEECSTNPDDDCFQTTSHTNQFNFECPEVGGDQEPNATFRVHHRALIKSTDTCNENFQSWSHTSSTQWKYITFTCTNEDMVDIVSGYCRNQNAYDYICLEGGISEGNILTDLSGNTSYCDSTCYCPAGRCIDNICEFTGVECDTEAQPTCNGDEVRGAIGDYSYQCDSSPDDNCCNLVPTANATISNIDDGDLEISIYENSINTLEGQDWIAVKKWDWDYQGGTPEFDEEWTFYMFPTGGGCPDGWGVDFGAECGTSGDAAAAVYGNGQGNNFYFTYDYNDDGHSGAGNKQIYLEVTDFSGLKHVWISDVISLDMIGCMDPEADQDTYCEDCNIDPGPNDHRGCKYDGCPYEAALSYWYCAIKPDAFVCQNETTESQLYALENIEDDGSCISGFPLVYADNISWLDSFITSADGENYVVTDSLGNELDAGAENLDDYIVDNNNDTQLKSRFDQLEDRVLSYGCNPSYYDAESLSTAVWDVNFCLGEATYELMLESNCSGVCSYVADSNGTVVCDSDWVANSSTSCQSYCSNYYCDLASNDCCPEVGVDGVDSCTTSTSCANQYPSEWCVSGDNTCCLNSTHDCVGDNADDAAVWCQPFGLLPITEGNCSANSSNFQTWCGNSSYWELTQSNCTPGNSATDESSNVYNPTEGTFISWANSFTNTDNPKGLWGVCDNENNGATGLNCWEGYSSLADYCNNVGLYVPVEYGCTDINYCEFSASANTPCTDPANQNECVPCSTAKVWYWPDEDGDSLAYGQGIKGCVTDFPAGTYITGCTLCDDGAASTTTCDDTYSFCLDDVNPDCESPDTDDACGVCSGTNSGHTANSDQDECGICFGNNTGCSSGGCVCSGCLDNGNCTVAVCGYDSPFPGISAANYDPDATIDDDTCVYYGTGGSGQCGCTNVNLDDCCTAADTLTAEDGWCEDEGFYDDCGVDHLGCYGSFADTTAGRTSYYETEGYYNSCSGYQYIVGSNGGTGGLNCFEGYTTIDLWFTNNTAGSGDYAGYYNTCGSGGLDCFGGYPDTTEGHGKFCESKGYYNVCNGTTHGIGSGINGVGCWSGQSSLALGCEDEGYYDWCQGNNAETGVGLNCWEDPDNFSQNESYTLSHACETSGYYDGCQGGADGSVGNNCFNNNDYSGYTWSQVCLAETYLNYCDDGGTGGTYGSGSQGSCWNGSTSWSNALNENCTFANLTGTGNSDSQADALQANCNWEHLVTGGGNTEQQAALDENCTWANLVQEGEQLEALEANCVWANLVQEGEQRDALNNNCTWSNLTGDGNSDSQDTVLNENCNWDNLTGTDEQEDGCESIGHFDYCDKVGNTEYGDGGSCWRGQASLNAACEDLGYFASCTGNTLDCYGDNDDVVEFCENLLTLELSDKGAYQQCQGEQYGEGAGLDCFLGYDTLLESCIGADIDLNCDTDGLNCWGNQSTFEDGCNNLTSDNDGTIGQGDGHWAVCDNGGGADGTGLNCYGGLGATVSNQRTWCENQHSYYALNYSNCGNDSLNVGTLQQWCEWGEAGHSGTGYWPITQTNCQNPTLTGGNDTFGDWCNAGDDNVPSGYYPINLITCANPSNWTDGQDGICDETNNPNACGTYEGWCNQGGWYELTYNNCTADWVSGGAINYDDWCVGNYTDPLNCYANLEGDCDSYCLNTYCPNWDTDENITPADFAFLQNFAEASTGDGVDYIDGGGTNWDNLEQWLIAKGHEWVTTNLPNFADTFGSYYGYYNECELGSAGTPGGLGCYDGWASRQDWAVNSGYENSCDDGTASHNLKCYGEYGDSDASQKTWCENQHTYYEINNTNCTNNTLNGGQFGTWCEGFGGGYWNSCDNGDGSGLSCYGGNGTSDANQLAWCGTEHNAYDYCENGYGTGGSCWSGQNSLELGCEDEGFYNYCDKVGNTEYGTGGSCWSGQSSLEEGCEDEGFYNVCDGTTHGIGTGLSCYSDYGTSDASQRKFCELTHSAYRVCQDGTYGDGLDCWTSEGTDTSYYSKQTFVEGVASEYDYFNTCDEGNGTGLKCYNNHGETNDGKRWFCEDTVGAFKKCQGTYHIGGEGLDCWDNNSNTSLIQGCESIDYYNNCTGNTTCWDGQDSLINACIHNDYFNNCTGNTTCWNGEASLVEACESIFYYDDCLGALGGGGTTCWNNETTLEDACVSINHFSNCTGNTSCWNSQASLEAACESIGYYDHCQGGVDGTTGNNCWGSNDILTEDDDIVEELQMACENIGFYNDCEGAYYIGTGNGCYNGYTDCIDYVTTALSYSDTCDSGALSCYGGEGDDGQVAYCQNDWFAYTYCDSGYGTEYAGSCWGGNSTFESGCENSLGYYDIIKDNCFDNTLHDGTTWQDWCESEEYRLITPDNCNDYSDGAMDGWCENLGYNCGPNYVCDDTYYIEGFCSQDSSSYQHCKNWCESQEFVVGEAGYPELELDPAVREWISYPMVDEFNTQLSCDGNGDVEIGTLCSDSTECGDGGECLVAPMGIERFINILEASLGDDLEDRQTDIIILYRNGSNAGLIKYDSFFAGIQSSWKTHEDSNWVFMGNQDTLNLREDGFENYRGFLIGIKTGDADGLSDIKWSLPA